ncbi:MAG: UDP-N-acetylenolpyruvoylglucosamine reductase, partial [Acidiphilium sp. 21-68-69]
MMVAPVMADWRAGLPEVRGRIGFDVPLGPVTWFRVGGPAEVMFRPADIDDLSCFLAALAPEVPVLPIGAASNLIVRDGGIAGVVVRLVRGFADIEVQPDGIVAGAAALDAT